MLKRLIGSILAAALLCVPVIAQAARVSPMIVELKPSGRASVARVELINQGTNDVPYEIRLMRGDIGEEGDLTLIPADDDFLVFPAQTIVQRNSQQVFRLQYVGNPDLDRSEIYYMSIQQVPVKIEPTQSQLQVVVNYNVLVNVVPDGTAPQARVETIEAVFRLPESDPEGEGGNAASTSPDTGASEEEAAREPQPGVRVRVSNGGTRYFYAGMSRWSVSGVTVAGERYSRSYRPEDMTRVIGVGVVAPDRTRAFFVPTDAPLVQDSIRVEVAP